MKPIRTPWVPFFATLVTVLAATMQAQQASPGPGIADAPSSEAVSPRVLSFSDAVAGQPDGALTVTFALYSDQQSVSALWSETQTVQVTQGKYTAMLGSTSSTGLPSDSFSADQARWLGVQINGVETRHLLVSVPYAMKAVEAERLGGLLPSQLVTVQQLNAALKNSVTVSSPAPGPANKTASGATPLASVNPPQPATDFTDNNASEVLLVTQQGTGFAIHAISAGDAALFGENTTPTGTAVKALASGTSGANIGLLAQSASPTGIAAVFDNTGNGKILSLRSNGNEVGGMDNLGDFTANQINATTFFGNGFGLFGIPPAAVNAQSASIANTIVMRDSSGSFSGNQINASVFFGNGFGLFGIPPAAVNAQSANIANTIVVRDSGGSFTANQINASVFSGNGFGLFGIPPSAVNAQSSNVANTIVMRDANGSFTANQINASVFFGNGFGLFGITPSGVNAQSTNVANTIVMRDSFGNFTANQINGSFIGLGNGLFGIPPTAVGAQSQNVANSIVMRDPNGNFAAGGIQAFGTTDFTAATSTAPVKAVTTGNTPTTCFASSDLLIKTDATPGQQLFICNATGNGYVLVGAGSAAGVTSVGAGDGSVAIGGTAAAPTVAVANGGITSAKLAPNAVAGSIADGSLSPAKTAGTAATLSGSNVFSGTQTMPSLSVAGSLSAGTASINGALTASNSSGTGIHGDGAIGVDASSNAVGLQVRTTGTDESAIAATFTNSQPGRTISARTSSGNSFIEQFNVDTSGNVFAAGALTAQYTNGGGANFAQLVKLQPNSTSDPQPVVPTTTTDQGGAIGIVTVTAGPNGPLVHVAYGGVAACLFDGTPAPGDYVGISHFTAGDCTDLGSSIPTVPQRQLIGRVVGVPTGNEANVLLFGPERFNGNGTVSSIFTGAGLQGGPITGSGTISIGFQSVTNNMLQNNSVTVSPGLGLSGGGAVSLGGSVVLQNAGALSFNGRTGNVVPAFGDYSFGQITGRAGVSQMAPGTVFTNLANTFTFDQTFNANITSTGSVSANSMSAANALSANYLTLAGNTNFTGPILTVNDNSATGGNGSLYVNSQNNTAAAFVTGSPVIMVAGTPTHNVLGVTASGMSVVGNVTATTFSGDGSALTNVNASTIGGVAGASLATTSALNTETTARVAGESTLQNNISSEASTRATADSLLQINLNNEAASRQAGDAFLQTNINSEAAVRQQSVNDLTASIGGVSQASAKLAASNTFTTGTQDFSGAGATLPVRSLPSAQTPASCVASKELLIKTDAPAGQQLFICDVSGATWNLVGDGASGGVTSFNGRNGNVSPGSGDYSFNQISGSLAAAQLPALTGDVTEAAGSGFTLLTTTGVTPGAYSKVNVDVKGRVVSGSQASFSDLTGSAVQGQLPGNVVYNNQGNIFSVSQTVNGNVTATAFIGNGGGLSNVNAATLNNLSSSSFAQLNTNNTFTGSVSASSFSGDGSGLTKVNAATVNSLQMLKLTSSITPSNVSSQTCNEQSFTVSGVNAGDVLLSAHLPTHSPGTNIAVGGARVAAANTVAIQFCNVSRSNSTPTAGTYTFALMR
jgi:hypothetical protein